MKLTFLGSGSAFTLGTGNYHSNMLLTNDHNQSLLIDCGSDARFSLNELGKHYQDISDVYISHLHSDHVGGLEWLALSTKFDALCVKPNLYIAETLIDKLWNNVLSGGLSTLQIETASIHSYFNLFPISQVNSVFNCIGIQFRMVQTVHVYSSFTILPSYGLIFNANGYNIFITTDTQFSPHQLLDFYNVADIIFHDCEIATKKSNVHAHYEQLVTLPRETRAKMWLYHYNPCPLPDAVKDGFRGFVKKGQCFDFSNPETLK